MSNSNNYTFSKQTLGVTRSRLNKFMEHRKKHIDETTSFKYDSGSGSSLNDNGKTRYNNGNYNNPSLLGDSQTIEMNSIEQSNYVDIFNSTNFIYDELRQNCKNKLIFSSCYPSTGTAEEDYTKIR